MDFLSGQFSCHLVKPNACIISGIHVRGSGGLPPESPVGSLIKADRVVAWAFSSGVRNLDFRVRTDVVSDQYATEFLWLGVFPLRLAQECASQTE